MNIRLLTGALFLGSIIGSSAVFAADPAKAPAATAKPQRPTPPERDPHGEGFVKATELPDGKVPPADADGNFIIGPTHTPAPEMVVAPSPDKKQPAKVIKHGKVFTFTME